jgi:hypothetical protein
MTDHPSDGQLQAYLDGEDPNGSRDGVEGHVLGCGVCRERVEELKALQTRVSAALRSLDPDPATAERAEVLWNIRRERARRRSGAHRQRLAAAAVVVLLLGAGAAAASLPGSPVRVWLGWEVEPTPAETAALDGADLVLDLRDGTGRVELFGLDRGTEVRVRIVPGDQVEVAAPVGASFETGPGWATVRGGGEGALSVSFPAHTRFGEILVEGSPRVTFDGEALRVDGEVVGAPPEEGRWYHLPPAPRPTEGAGNGG